MRFLLLLILGLLAQPATSQTPTISPTFWQQQLAYARVQAAYARCWPALAARLHA